MAFGYWEARLKTVQDLEAILGDLMSGTAVCHDILGFLAGTVQGPR